MNLKDVIITIYREVIFPPIASRLKTLPSADTFKRLNERANIIAQEQNEKNDRIIQNNESRSRIEIIDLQALSTKTV